MKNRIHLFERPLRNLTCPYCGKDIDVEPADKEHVVGRRFVPKGSLDGSHHIILQAHRRCNGIKSDLEDDISAWTLHPDLIRGFDGMSDMARDEAQRKLSKSFIRGSGKAMADGREELTAAAAAPGLKFSASFTGLPRVEYERIFRLAYCHILGFFYALTYDPEKRLGRCWPESGFYPISFARRGDWGNEIHRWFIDRVANWHDRLVGPMADDHFRVAIRRSPDAELWSFALEWNNTTRVIGFFGREEPANIVLADVPELTMVPFGTTPDGALLRGRREVPLDTSEDRLFYFDELAENG